MAKGQNAQKAVKKKSDKTLKEKRAEKKEKKSNKRWMPILIKVLSNNQLFLYAPLIGCFL